MAAPMKYLSNFNYFYNILVNSTKPLQLKKRCLSSFRDIKKFYKNASITQSEGYCEINLDKRKLKTPNGQLFCVPSEALALTVATEWNNQQDIIKPHSMYMTNLCNAAIDNPTQRSSADIIKAITHFLHTDTVCFRVTDPDALVEMQREQWDPVLDWFNQRYSVNIPTTTSILSTVIPESTLDSLRHHLSSYSHWSLLGINSAVESLKSLVLTLAVVDKAISVDTGLQLSRLETNFQTEYWGTVEWHHDIDLHDTRARLSAAILFTQFCSESTSIKHKLNRDRITL